MSKGRRLTIRTRLALLFGATWLGAAALLLVGLFVAVLVVPDYGFRSESTDAVAGIPLTPSEEASVAAADPGAVGPAEDDPGPAVDSVDDLRAYLIKIATVGVLICAALAVLFGWLVAGRMLSPIGRITRAAESIAAGNLHQRVALGGPPDELTRLADTFDGMLARLEQAFAAQSRFAANASHELLTPLATARTILETTPRGAKSEVEVAALSGKLLTLNERSERIVDALLTLAKADQAPVQYRAVNLTTLVAEAIDRVQDQAAEQDVTIESAVHYAMVGGNPVLCGQLADNLLSNAVRYNRPGGTIRVTLSAHEDHRVVLEISNTGPAVPPDLVDQLFDPFVRAKGRNHRGDGAGHGLGMAIVKAVAHAHSGTVEARANSVGGGLTVTVVLPAPPHDI